VGSEVAVGIRMRVRAPARTELDRKKREALLHRAQPLVHDKAMFAPIWELAFVNGYGPRLAESGLGLITDYFHSAPYEDVRLKTR
jgi:peptide/nickel transport system substrate-binding protein